MTATVQGFFAYASQPPSVPEAITVAVRKINAAHVCHIKTWQECHVGGKLLIDVICNEIQRAQLFCADLTGANPNVMFELGYAIARKKRIWLILDTSIEDSKRHFDQLRILTTVGYNDYCNSEDICEAFFHERPWADLHNSIFNMSIAPTLGTSERETLLYLKARHATEGAMRLAQQVQQHKLPLTIDDPRESSVQPLAWYARKALASMGILAHLCGPRRHGSTIDNSRYAFVAGLAHGFDKNLLILAEDDFVSPIDYRDIVRHYRTATDCVRIADEWLGSVATDYARREQYHLEYKRARDKHNDLKSLYLGEYIAENEEESLPEYFVDTSFYQEALSGRTTLVVGRKGAGKTANLYAIANRLKTDKRILVCVVKPASYELESIVRLIRQCRERDEKGYLVEALWKFLLYTEIARSAADELDARRDAILPGSPEDQLLRMVADNRAGLQEEFAIRLERAVTSLLDMPSREGVEAFRVAVSETLHGGLLQDLRTVLGNVLTKRERVAVLVDNLDKAWDKRSDYEYLSDFLLGVLRVTRDIRQDFSKRDHWREPVAMTLTVFLRSDIFTQIMKTAREPDKIAYSRLVWNDPETLLRVVDERLVANRGEKESPERIWEEMFCRDVRGVPIREYITSHVLPRPRDIVFFTSVAVATAVNRGHAAVEEEDVCEAEKQYSQFVFDSIQVENGLSVPELEAVLYEFAGQRSILGCDEVAALVAKAGISSDRCEYAIRHLCALSFLGVETKLGQFAFSADEEEAQKNEVIARKLASSRGAALTYKVNTPFYAFLQIAE